MANNKPAATFRIGFVKATIWKNKNGDNTFYNVNVSRSYKDGDEYKDGDSFGQADLLNLSKVAERAEAFIAAQ